MNRAAILAFMLFGASVLSDPAAADTRDDVISAATRCSSIADQRSWLDCYYGAAQPMRAVLGLQPAPSVQTSLVPAAGAKEPMRPAEMAMAPAPAQASSSGSGGILEAITGRDIVIKNVPAASIKFDKKGMFTITLANGEVWQQLDDDEIHAHWSGPATRYLVTIEKNWFGARFLEVQADKGRYKVRRIT